MAAYDYEIVLHKAQRAIFDSDSRYRVVCSGRRFGKSNLVLNELVYRTLSFQGKVSSLSPETVLAVMPTSVMARQVLFKPLMKLVLETNLKYLLAKNGINQTEMRIQFLGKPAIKVCGANDQGGSRMRGMRLYFVFCDEVQDIDPTAWLEVLSPAMADTPGSRALFTGTPKGKQNFLYQLSQNTGDGWEFFNFPTASNPCIPRSEIELAKATLPPRVFAQEFYAEFVSFQGQIYTELSSANIWQGTREELPSFDLVVAGVDWGAIHPAISILGRDGRAGVWYWLEGWSPNIAGTNEPILISRVHDNLRRLCDKWQVDLTYCDPAQPSEILAIRTLGRDKCYQSAKSAFNPIAEGINQVHGLIFQQKLLFCQGLADETSDSVDGVLAFELLQSYHYLTRKGLVLEEPSDGSFSHICDSTRYALAYKGGGT